MQTTRNILITTIAGLCTAAAASAASLGSATITVLHPYTLEPVPKVPVTVVAVIKPETKFSPYWTGRRGSVTITGLPEGRYEAYVNYNNIVSERVRFDVIADYHPFVTVFFNPDIDN
jgi:hypothetical protein